jgi:hypothetical protein
MAFKPVREMLNLFATEMTSFVVYTNSQDSVNVYADGKPMPKTLTFPWLEKSSAVQKTVCLHTAHMEHVSGKPF